ncbi:MAG: TIR domain-containing protein [Anaerolineaceae bacterium]
MKQNKSCFISYSYDSPEHINWVNRLARKISQRGIIVHLDKLDNKLGDDLLNYMISAISNSDKVIVICTPKYYEKVNGGAAFEKMIIGSKITADILTNKFIPILHSGSKEKSIPLFLHTKYFLNMPSKMIHQIEVDEIVKAINIHVPNKKMNNKKTNRVNEFIKTSTIEIADVSNFSRVKIFGYTLLGGRGSDGIRYLWKSSDNSYIESIAFNNRLKAYEISDIDKQISAYTTSVSFGCQLQSMGLSCSFCATGKLKFRGNLAAEEIALQNVFMAEYDSECPSWPEVRNHSREFAFMGQGEPGLCYPQIRRAILLTDSVMNRLNQKIHRYIISTSGIPEMLDSLLSDLKLGVYQNKISLHFSLHAVGQQRNSIMPINKLYNYRRFLFKSRDFAALTGDKVAIGVLLFENFKSKHNSTNKFTTTEEYLESILSELDPTIHRIDLCDLNLNTVIDSQTEVSNERAHKLLKTVLNHGFEAKLFSSFGTDKNSGCGMLISSRIKKQTPGTCTIEHFNRSVELVKQASIEIS